MAFAKQRLIFCLIDVPELAATCEPKVIRILSSIELYP